MYFFCRQNTKACRQAGYICLLISSLLGFQTESPAYFSPGQRLGLLMQLTLRPERAG